MEYRQARIEDLNEISRLGSQLLNSHQEIDANYYQLEADYRDKFRHYISSFMNSQSQIIMVALDKEKIVGFIAGYIKPLFPWFQIKNVGHISFLVVQKNYQKRGIGRNLTNKLEKWFKEQNLQYIEVYTNEKNQSGVAAWTDYGFAPFNKFLRKKI